MTAPNAASAVRVLPALLVVGGLLGAGLGCYAVFALHVLDRGDAIVDEAVESPEAFLPLVMGSLGVLLMAGSGVAGLARRLRGFRLAPLAAFGLPLATAALVGGSAFALGKSAFTLVLILLAPSLLTAVVACLVPPGPPTLARFLLRSWMATGFLIGLALMVAGGLSLLEDVLPHVPWASGIAGLAIGTLIQLAARYVARHGGEVEGLARDHQQVRQLHETAAIQEVAQRLHPFIEEGRDGADYEALARQLGQATQQPAASAPRPPAGPPAVPPALAGLAALLRSLAFGLPLALLVPDAGLGLAVLTVGFALPFARLQMAPRGDPSSRLSWLAGALLMAAGGALAILPFGLEPVASAWATVLGAPYLVVLLTTLRRRRGPAHLAYLRAQHARRLAERSRRAATGGFVLAGAALAATPLLWLVSFLIGIPLPEIPLPVLAAMAASGLLWSGAASFIGPAAASHRAKLGEQQVLLVQDRLRAHRAFLERLEMN